MSRRPASNLLSFVVAATAVVAALGVAAVTGRTRADDVLRYLPKEADMVLATSDVRSLWRVLAEHFAATARRLEEGESVDEAPACALAEPDLDALRGCAAAIRRGGFDALVANGIDVERGLVVGLVGIDTPRYVVQVGVRDRERFAAWLATLAELSAAPGRVTLPPGASDVAVTAYCANPACATHVYLAFPPGGRALVTNSRLMLDRALANGATNHAHGWDDDALAATLRDVERPGTGRIALLVRPPTDAGPLRRLTARMRGDAAAFTMEGELDVESQRSRLLAAFLKPPAAPPAWVASLGRDTPAAITLMDDDARRFVAWTARQVEGGERGWPSVLRRLGDVRGLRAVTFATTGRRASLPDFLLGGWGERGALDEMTTQLQHDLYASRDRAVLAAALADPRAKEAQAADVRQLVRVRVLVPEPRLTAAVVTGGQVVKLGVPRAGEERLVHAGRAITYLGPRLTRNDLELRPEFERFRGKPVEQEILTSDRGRLAAMPMDDGLLWIATDVEALKAIAARSEQAADPLTRGLFFTPATVSWTARDKVEIFVDIARLAARGMLTPESGIANAIREPLAALRDHPALALNVGAVDGRSRLRFSVRLLRADTAP